jgi:hypothetical protein
MTTVQAGKFFSCCVAGWGVSSSQLRWQLRANSNLSHQTSFSVGREKKEKETRVECRMERPSFLRNSLFSLPFEPRITSSSFLSEEHSFLFVILSLVFFGLLQRRQTTNPGFSLSLSSSLTLSSEGAAVDVESSDDDMVSFDTCQYCDG